MGGGNTWKRASAWCRFCWWRVDVQFHWTATLGGIRAWAVQAHQIARPQCNRKRGVKVEANG